MKRSNSAGLAVPDVLRLRLNPEKAAEVRWMMMETGISKSTELCNSALTLLKWAIEQRKRGYEIAAYQEKGKKVRIVAMPGLDAVRSEDDPVIASAV